MTVIGQNGWVETAAMTPRQRDDDIAAEPVASEVAEWRDLNRVDRWRLHQTIDLIVGDDDLTDALTETAFRSELLRPQSGGKVARRLLLARRAIAMVNTSIDPDWTPPGRPDWTPDRWAVSRLPVLQRQAFALYRRYCVDTVEVATVLSTSEPNAAAVLARARTELRAAYGRDGGSP
jgi:DNA-directed RNA polymerase specialized sigma24 family protein